MKIRILIIQLLTALMMVLITMAGVQGIIFQFMGKQSVRENNDESWGVRYKNLEALNESSHLLMSADRDAYQVRLAQSESLHLKSTPGISELKNSAEENLEQVEVRVNSAIESKPELQKQLRAFQNDLAQWKVNSEAYFQLLIQGEDESKLQVLYRENGMNMHSVRDGIDMMLIVLEEEIKTSHDEIKEAGLVDHEEFYSDPVLIVMMIGMLVFLGLGIIVIVVGGILLSKSSPKA